MKTEIWYHVKNGSGRQAYVPAVSSAHAKRQFCRLYGFRPSDPWLGVSSLSAHKLTPKELEDWRSQAEDTRDLAVFLEGMLEIFSGSRKEVRSND